jgi:hypothetical protein
MFSFHPSSKSLPQFSTSGAGVLPERTETIYPLKTGIKNRVNVEIRYATTSSIHCFHFPYTASCAYAKDPDANVLIDIDTPTM